MTNFIKDNTGLGAAKSNSKALGSIPADRKVAASDWNEHRQALLDIQSYLRGGSFAPAPSLIDTFERPDQSGLGNAESGQTWQLTGAGVANAQIKSGRFTGATPPSGDSTVYAGIVLPQTPITIGGRISFVAGPGGGSTGVIALISSNDASITLQHMVHLVISPTQAGVTWWEGASIDQPMASGGTVTFATPLATDGTSYEVWMTIVGDNVHVDFPDGTSHDWYDPKVSALAGSLAIFEVAYNATSTFLPRWDSVEAYPDASLELQGTLHALGGVVSTLGTHDNRSAVWANVINALRLLIGVEDSVQSLHVKDGTAEQARFESSGTPARIRLVDNNGTGYNGYIGIGVLGASNVGLFFQTGNGAANVNMVIDVNGDVGIGIGSAVPSAKLQVSGTVKATDFAQGAGPVWKSGSGTPEGVVTAPVGSLFSRTDGGAGTSLYVKQSGAGNTGWVGK